MISVLLNKTLEPMKWLENDWNLQRAPSAAAAASSRRDIIYHTSPLDDDDAGPNQFARLNCSVLLLIEPEKSIHRSGYCVSSRLDLK